MGGQAEAVGNFYLEKTNLADGVTWELNRPITLEFNHPVDPASVSFSSVQIVPVSPEVQGQPVTGTFSFEAGSDNRTLVFRPTCPTNAESSDGAFVPGGYEYRLRLPTAGSGGASVLRDTAGRLLSRGTSITFRTPDPPAEQLFLDTSPTPPSITSVDWPEGLNFFTDPDPIIEIQFDQAIDASDLNISAERLYVLYADAEIGQSGENDFPDSNRVPGTLELAANCTETGATIWFQISGLLPPNRRLRLVMENTFADIAGQTNVSQVVWPEDHETPSLAEVYAGTGWDDSEDTIDEFSDHFDDTSWIDADAGLLAPPADVVDGTVQASFDFPGAAVSEDADFFWSDSYGEISTDGQVTFIDSNGRSFLVINGVLNCDDFTIAEGATLRGRGTNPLIIYASGDMLIDGHIDVSGNDSHWPTSLNSPQFPEGGGNGECGGGKGGDSSQVTDRETLRGQNGDGPFGLTGGGGQGGEGSFQQNNSDGSGDAEALRKIAGGAGGGGFARTPNVCLWWEEWQPHEILPADDRDMEPDHNGDYHTAMQWNRADFYDQHPWWPRGAEDGMRGSSYEIGNSPNGTLPHGCYGMEDMQRDLDVPEDHDQLGATYLDPQWTSGDTPPFDFGNPVFGPDPGKGGPSVFSDDGNLLNDFWGRRLNSDGTVSVGELLTPWAGSGGGGSGDSQDVERPSDGQGGLVPITDVWPVRPFWGNGWYRKGAPGGGGGGQLLLMAVGEIEIGPEGLIEANGGIGQGGESVIFTYYQISGGGGGSGGHIVIHTATRLNLSRIDPNDGVPINNANQFFNTLVNDNFEEKWVVQARGGRRGWCCSRLDLDNGNVVESDGNNTFMLGRGGAGANGVIQVHVPNPLTDIRFHSNVSNGFWDYATNGTGTVVDTDKLEQVLSLYMVPQPYVLIPFYSSTSQIQSKWIDTGLAFLRRHPDGVPPFTTPDWSNDVLKFEGINTTSGANQGLVLTSGGKVTPLSLVVTGDVDDVTFASFSLTIPNASTVFTEVDGTIHFLRHPRALIGYEVLPNTSGSSAFEIVDASWDRDTDRMLLNTRTSDGSMTFSVDPPNPWGIRKKFFRIDTSGLKDSLPSGTAVRFEFQGADDPEDTASIVPGVLEWTADLSELQGKRFIRYRVTFDIDANGTGVTPTSPRPVLDYFKLPFVW